MGKSLGHQISQREIEVDPDKVKAIIEMPAPRIKKEVQGFLKKFQYISRFIVMLNTFYKPIFKLVRKNQLSERNDECQTTFEKIKQYLMHPLVLEPPMLGIPLTLYLFVEEIALGAILTQEVKHVMGAVYYISKKLLPYKQKYSLIEKLVW